MGDGG
jgi:hypothetical protein